MPSTRMNEGQNWRQLKLDLKENAEHTLVTLLEANGAGLQENTPQPRPVCEVGRKVNDLGLLCQTPENRESPRGQPNPQQTTMTNNPERNLMQMPVAAPMYSKRTVSAPMNRTALIW